MKATVVLVGVVICSLWCGKADAACSFEDVFAYGLTTLSSNLACLTGLNAFLRMKDTTQSTLSSVCTDNCGGVIYRWYLQNCQGNPSGLFNATLLSDSCSQNSNGVYCAQAAANINTTLLGGCVASIAVTENCSTYNCNTLIQASLSSLGCCYNSTSSSLNLATVTPTLQNCSLVPAVGSCRAPFSVSPSPSPSPTPNAAAANTAAALVFYLGLLYVCAVMVCGVW